MPIPYLDYLAMVLAGALMCNAIPHLAAGLRGEPFPTPFARPRGVGRSSALLNFLWGTVNLAAAIQFGARGIDLPYWLGAAAVGFVALGVYLSRHFAKVRRDW